MSNAGYSALSNVYGRIEELLLTYPGSNTGQSIGVEQVESKFGGIWEALESRVKYFVLGDFKDKKLFNLIGSDFEQGKNKFAGQRPYQVTPLVADFKIETPDSPAAPRRIFAQDPFLILMDRYGNRAFLEPYYFPGKGDSIVAEQVAAQTAFHIKPSRYFLEGGNVLVGSDYAIVGADTVEKNRREYFSQYTEGEGNSLLTQHLKKVLGVDYLVVPRLATPLALGPELFSQGSERQQPLYHLDLFLTLGGRTQNGEEIVYVAELKHDKGGIRYIKGTCLNEKEIAKLAGALDETANFFIEFGSQEIGPDFMVRRLPIELIANRNLVDAPVLRSFNNCLMEVFEGNQNVYLPRYSDHDQEMAKSDSVTRRVNDQFIQDGYKVKWVHGDFDSLAEKDASLHCIVKVMRRRRRRYV